MSKPLKQFGGQQDVDFARLEGLHVLSRSD
jgi:hypothetical protein